MSLSAAPDATGCSCERASRFTRSTSASPARTSPSRLTLNAPRAAFVQKRIHLGHAHVAEVAGNRVLQATRRHREIERLLPGEPAEHAINQSGREAIARADTIDDVSYLIPAADEEL